MQCIIKDIFTKKNNGIQKNENKYLLVKNYNQCDN